MTEYRTFKSGEILSSDERAKLSPEDRKRYDVQEKIRKAMAIADDPSIGEDERAQAQRTVAKLIVQYEIDVTALMDKSEAKKTVTIEHFVVNVSNRYGMGGIRARALSRAVVVPLGGKMVFYHSSSDPTSVETRCDIFMPDDMVDFAKFLIASLTLQVETSMKVAAVQYQREIKFQVAPRHVSTMVAKFRKGYMLAWGSTVGRRMDQGREEARQEASAATGKEVALRDVSTLVENAVTAMYGKTRTARSVKISVSGATAGRRDGMRANLGNNELARA